MLNRCQAVRCSSTEVLCSIYVTKYIPLEHSCYLVTNFAEYLCRIASKYPQRRLALDKKTPAEDRDNLGTCVLEEIPTCARRVSRDPQKGEDVGNLNTEGSETSPKLKVTSFRGEDRMRPSQGKDVALRLLAPPTRVTVTCIHQ